MNHSCHGDGVTRSREHGYETCPKSHCCSIWCGDDEAGLLGAVVMATNAQSQKRLHKIGQVCILFLYFSRQVMCLNHFKLLLTKVFNFILISSPILQMCVCMCIYIYIYI